MKKIPSIIAFFIMSISILFSTFVFAATTQCPDNPGTASPSDWVITQPLPNQAGYFSQATIIGYMVFCNYNLDPEYFGNLRSVFTINPQSLNPKYWNLRNCHGFGSLCCNQSPELCTFTAQ